MGSSALKTAPPRRPLSEERKGRGSQSAAPMRKRSECLIFDLAALSAFADELECIHFSPRG